MSKLTTLNLIFFLAFFVLSACGSNSDKSSEAKDNTQEVESVKEETENLSTSNPQEQKQNPNPKQEAQKKKNVLRIVSWNLYNLGRTKSNDDLAYMAKQVKDFDIVAIQEIVTSPPGAKALAQIADELNRMGSKWDYKLSEVTVGAGIERYAFLWKTSKVSLQQAYLENASRFALDREPQMGQFKDKKSGKTFWVLNFHAVPSGKNPETEIILLEYMHHKYKPEPLILLGDFNLSEKHEAYDEIKRIGYKPCVTDQKTSIRMKVTEDGESLSQEYDNIFYMPSLIDMKKSGVIHFYKDYPTLREARNISDHIPVWMDFELL
ncbi:MAG: endonuclease/exonuclease/phosphatase family protein [Bernardetiaceae bacterium]|nr:endonuclease/exonuclease/phosphatase family protein [Bernardetiaceae bacterium]